jgi:hypothetical protein
MKKKLEATTRKILKPRGRKGGRKPLPPGERSVQANIYLPAELNDDLQNLVPLASDRNKLFTSWARAYLVANGESNRLLAQSPTAIKLLNYLEQINAPLELRDELESLIVQRDFEERKAEAGTAPDGIYIL